MIPPFTERHDELRREIRTFVAEELRPHAGEWERAGWFPNEVFARMGELGLLGLLAFRMTEGDEEIGRAMRDTRLGPIGGGTDEVMKEMLAKQLGLSPTRVDFRHAHSTLR